MKKSNDTNGNRTRDLLACSAVPQPTAPPRAPTPSRAEVKERLEIYLFPLLISVARSRIKFTFAFTLYPTLTLRLLVSYIYMEQLFLMFLDHTQRRSTVGRTPLDE